MSKDKKPEQQASVTTIARCKSEKCTKKDEKMGFCMEHFTWFKEGLITRDGVRPPDFDKKYQAFMHKKKVA